VVIHPAKGHGCHAATPIIAEFEEVVQQQTAATAPPANARDHPA
jgi:hypothetical protein